MPHLRFSSAALYALLLLALLLFCALTVTPRSRSEQITTSVPVSAPPGFRPDAWAAANEAAAVQRWYAVASLPPAPVVEVVQPRSRSKTSRSSIPSSSASISTTTSSGGDSRKACVARVENGGDYGRSANPSHFGRYQFSRGTWAHYGGDPATWGHASPEEQDAVFDAAWASPGGPSNWLPYDRC